MLFLTKLLLLNFINPRLTSKIIELVSLFSPAVDENSRSHRYNFADDYVIRTYDAKLPYIQLGYISGPTTGSLLSRNSLPENFKVDVNISANNVLPKSSFHVYLTKNKEPLRLELNKFKNLNDDFVFSFYCEKDPIVGVSFNKENVKINAAGLSNKLVLKNKIYGQSCSLRLEYFNHIMTVYMKVGKQAVRELFKVECNLNDVNLGIQTINDSSQENEFIVQWAKVFELTEALTTEKIKERKSSWKLYLIFILGCLGVGYLLFFKDKKSLIGK
ncbi:hypothetical protein EDEG_02089 [Edhazardia aedis USNM 41457]|uniref:L-type lectin-like domain-containing protein n=1 Tax=Edhazardia aedis (strain USNM 41457) TaxID=1003232 RepID=J9DQJ5_EDHAE|nr:hypothetical protein EDEG_02089 [Edhazardia aedis USNM 41457]|eukprot:EJW03577.1 hypothetical protein EDEG_02089 [Edhazardia aedis USNM 41457]